jgi:hypothetical protein
MHYHRDFAWNAQRYAGEVLRGVVHATYLRGHCIHERGQTEPSRKRMNVVQVQRLHFWTERPNADARARENGMFR